MSFLDFLCMLTSRVALCHSSVHFFDISTSKSARRMMCLYVFLAFWLQNVLRATTTCIFLIFCIPQLLQALRGWGALYILTSKCASRQTPCTFWASQLQKVLRTWCGLRLARFDFHMCFAPQSRALVFIRIRVALNVLTSKRASRHNGAQYLISHLMIFPDGSAPAALASLFCDPPQPQDIGKTQCFTTFLPFRTLLRSSLLTSSFLWLFPPLLFHLSVAEVSKIGNL